MSAVDGAPLRLEQQAEVDALLAAVAALPGTPAERSLSDPWFANLYLFRKVHDYRWLPGAHPCISGRAYDGTRHLLPLFDLQAASDDTLRTLLRGHACFYPLAQEQVDRLDPQRFEWLAGRDDADYLYPAAHFLHYRGTALGKKRNLVKQLLAAHDVRSAPLSEAEAGAAHDVLQGWMADKAKAEGEADEAACAEALALSSHLGLQGFVYRADGAPAGFVLAQPVGHGVFVMRFAKGLDRFKGIYQYMFQHFCQATPEVQWLNFEQDMGLANFRRSKLSYQPAALIPKYRVSLRLP